MGLMDKITEMAKGAMQGSDANLSVLKGLGEIVNQNGGLAGMVQKFQSGGLNEIVKSWVGTGANHPISTDQIQAVLGSETITKMAQKAGLSPEVYKQKMTEYLPKIVDKLTPEGKLPTQGITISQILEVGTGLLGKK
jgi:uncharacterized protein YidB (DUF937 family)